MSSHATAEARDPARPGAIHDAALPPPGHARRWRDGRNGGGPPGLGWAAPGARVPTSSVQGRFDRRPAGAGDGRAVVPVAPSPGAVREARPAGGANGGAPGERLRDGRGHHGARLRDPGCDGPRAIHRGDPATGR